MWKTCNGEKKKLSKLKLECMIVVAEANGVGRNKMRHHWSKILVECTSKLPIK
jgi:hypothetical protein